MTQRDSSTCSCPAYSWPHRRTGGKCIWNPSHDKAICEACGQPCEYTVYVPEPEERSPNGAYASDEAVSSDCCSAAVILQGGYLTPGDA